GFGSSRPGLLAYTFSAFVAASIAVEFACGTRARHALGAGSCPAALGSLVARNRRRYGGYVVHAAIVLLAIGIAGSSAYETVREQKLRPGESMVVAGDTYTYIGVTSHHVANATQIRAAMDISGGGRIYPG